MFIRKLYKPQFIVRLIVYGLAMLPAIALLLLQRVLHECNLLLLRTAPIDASRLGWFYNLDWHLKLGKRSKVVNLYFNRPSVPYEVNEPFLSLWKQHIRVLKLSPILHLAHKLNQKLGANLYVYPMKDWTLINGDPKYLKLMVEAPPLDFDFDDSPGSRAEKEFRGLQIDAPFVCFHNRDSSYLKSVSPAKDWSHHDFRDSNINNLAAAVKHLNGNGFSCVRMGTRVEKRLAQEGLPKVPLYSATEKQTDLLDLYLTKNCKFFITGDTGINILPYMFKKPIVFHNWTNIKNSLRYIPCALFIPKMYFSQEEDRLLSFGEMINGVLKDLILTADLDKRGIIAVENTEEEIKQVVIEMDQRLAGRWKESKRDTELQKLFWDQFEPATSKAKNFRIGTHFLRKYEHLI